MRRRRGSSAAVVLRKLQGLEKMYVAGLVDERTYQRTSARLQAQLDALAPAAVGALPAATPPAAAPPVSGQPARSRARRVMVGTTAACIVVLGGGVGVLIARSNSRAVTSRAEARSSPAPTPARIVAADPALDGLRSAPPVSATAVINPAAAETLVRHFWPQREQALSQRDTAAIGHLETGVAAEWDAVSCGSTCTALRPRPLIELRLFVPREPAFPAAFLAEVLTTTPAGDGAQLERLVFARASSRSLWSLALDASAAGVEHVTDAPQTDSGGFDQPAPALPHAIPPSELPAALAAYDAQWADHGSAPANTLVQPSAFTDVVGQRLWQQRSDNARAGWSEQTSFAADPVHDGVWTFAMSVLDSNGLPRFGWTVTCGTVRHRIVVGAGGAAHPVVQPADASRFGALLRPGTYARVTEIGLDQTCIDERPDLPLLSVSSGAGGTTSVTGVAAR